MTQLYIRRANLVVTDSGGKGLDLSQMRIIFRVWAMDVDRPPTAMIRVYNLKQENSKKIAEEYESVKLQAGYEDGSNYGVIFQGTIKQVRRGRLNLTDSFTDIYAADGDIWRQYNWMNETLAQASQEQIVDRIVSRAEENGVSRGQIDLTGAGQGGAFLPRGKVLFGLAAYSAGNAAASTNTTWFVQDGKINFVNRTGYLPGEIIKLNGRSGLVDFPEATLDGVEVKCLLNPKIKVGHRVQIDQKAINQLSAIKSPESGGFPNFSSVPTFPANVTADGIYRVLVVEHSGDNRGSESSDWFTYLTCLALDASAPADDCVKPG